MNRNAQKQALSEEIVKFAVPKHLKVELQSMAMTRNISLSALVRLVVTDYLKNRSSP